MLLDAIFGRSHPRDEEHDVHATQRRLELFGLRVVSWPHLDAQTLGLGGRARQTNDGRGVMSSGERAHDRAAELS